MKSLRLLMYALLLFVAATRAGAADYVLAHVGPFSGPRAVDGIANHKGAQACIDEANATGGLHGRKFRLVQEDDEYSPQSTVRLVRQVAKRDAPVAFLNLLGSANAIALQKDKTFEELKVPVVGVTPGADVLRKPGNPWIFHIHASDNAQLARILSHLSTIGLKRVAIAYQDIPFGHGGLKFLEENAEVAKVQIVGRARVPSSVADLPKAVAPLRQSGAQAYIMVLVPDSAATFVDIVRAGGDVTPIYGMSYVSAATIVQKVGVDKSIGIGLAQVTPNPSSATSRLVREFQAAIKNHVPKAEQTQPHLIGYLSCRVLLEGMRAAGPGATSERLRLALQRLRTEIGDYLVDFSGGNEASRFVTIGVISKEGRLVY